MVTIQRKVVSFEFKDGKSPIMDWLRSIKDENLERRILSRISRLQGGNLGDYKSVGGGVFELRIFTTPGVRIYFAFDGLKLIILLSGGFKDSQAKDILYAKQLWRIYKYEKSKD